MVSTTSRLPPSRAVLGRCRTSTARMPKGPTVRRRTPLAVCSHTMPRCFRGSGVTDAGRPRRSRNNAPGCRPESAALAVWPGESTRARGSCWPLVRRSLPADRRRRPSPPSPPRRRPRRSYARRWSTSRSSGRAGSATRSPASSGTPKSVASPPGAAASRSATTASSSPPGTASTPASRASASSFFDEIADRYLKAGVITAGPDSRALIQDMLDQRGGGGRDRR